MNLNGIRLDKINQEINQLMIYDSIFIRILKKKPNMPMIPKSRSMAGSGKDLLMRRTVAWGIMHGVTVTASEGRGKGE